LTEAQKKEEEELKQCMVLTSKPTEDNLFFRYIPDRQTTQRMIMRAANLPADFMSFDRYRHPVLNDDIEEDL